MPSVRWMGQARRAAAVTAVLGIAAALAGCAANGYGNRPLSATTTVAEAPKPKPAPLVKPEWSAHFKNVSKGAILVSLNDHRLAYWSPGGADYKEFPIAVPRSPALERRGRTQVVRRRKNPDWRPTPDMRRRNPSLPRYIGPGPHNPLGERALYLGWRYYAIHGTNDVSSIGSRATSGCFRMYPEHIEWLYEQVALGTPVRVVNSVPEIGERRLSLRAVNDPTALANQIYRRPGARAPRQVVHRAPRLQPVASEARLSSR